MTNATSTTEPTTSLAADDPRARLATAVRLAVATTKAIPAGRVHAASLCDGLDARALALHIADALQGVAALGRGDDPFANRTATATTEGDDPEVLAAAITSAAHEVQAAFADDASLEVVRSLPWLTDTGAKHLLGYAGEVTVHTWDLSRATGVEVAWDEDLLQLLLDLPLGSGMPATGRRAYVEDIMRTMGLDPETAESPFADAVPVPADAPRIDRLVAWYGRQP